ncbi:MAG: Ig-like domain-containing protein [Patescibacteria group bacterium]
MIKVLKRRWYIIVLAFVASVLVAWKLLSPPALPSIVAIQPLPDKTTSLDTKEIQITFDQNVDVDTFDLFVTPELLLAKQAQGKVLVFQITQPLKPETEYLLELSHAGSSYYSWKWTTEARVVESKLEIGDPEIPKEVAQQVGRDYPLIAFVPYETANFVLTYTGPNKLGVKIKSGDKQDIKWQVYDWLKEKGVDPDSHQIEWFE